MSDICKELYAKKLYSYERTQPQSIRQVLRIAEDKLLRPNTTEVSYWDLCMFEMALFYAEMIADLEGSND